MIDRRALLASGLATAGTRVAEGGRPSRSAALSEVTTELARDAVAAKVAGLTVVVTQADQSPFSWQWGYASLPFRVPMTDRTLMMLASTTKHITAIAVLKLVDMGKLSLDDPLSRHLAGAPPRWGRVTIRHLLTHTSGIPDYWSFFPDWERPQPRQEVFAKVAGAPLSFAPGDAWAYANMNYRLLGWLIDDLSGQPYAGFLHDHLFAPGGLPDARVDAAQDVILSKAEGYEVVGGRQQNAMLESNDLSSAADGAVLFSGRDFVRWDRTLANSGLLSPAERRETLTPATLATGRDAPYGFGWYIDRMRGQTCHWHGGSAPGHVCYYLRLPEHGVSVAVLSNSSSAAPLVRRAGLHLVEAAAPGSTYLSAPALGDGTDPRTLRAKAILSGTFPDSWLAPEAARLKAANPGDFQSFPGTIKTIVPVEEYPVRGGRMQRFRVTMDGGDRYALIGWTEQDQVFWNGA